jgi:hypothetical protein
MVYFAINQPRGYLWEYYLLTLPIYFTSFGLGYFVSVAVRDNLAQLAGVTVVLISMLLGGMRPTLPKWIEDIGYPLAILPWFSYMRYAQEAIYLTEIKHYYHLFDNGKELQPALDRLGYDQANLWWCIVVLVGYGVLFRILTLFFLYTHKENTYYQKVRSGVLTVISRITDWKTHKSNIQKLVASCMRRRPRPHNINSVNLDKLLGD